MVAAFNKINKYALMSRYSDIEPNLNPKESLLSYRLCQIKTEIENLAKDVSDDPVKIENTVNPSICDVQLTSLQMLYRIAIRRILKRLF